MFREIIPQKIWICDYPLRFLGVPIGTRMTVVRLQNKKLFIHSPVELKKHIQAELEMLGEISYVVSPNNLHHIYIGDYFDEFKYAKIFASPGLAKKRTDLHFRHELNDEPEAAWENELDQTIFYGHESLREVIFYHKESRTLILADLIMCFDDHSPFLTRLITKMLGIYNRAAPPLDFENSLSQKVQARISAERILQWDFDKVILSHGSIIEKNGKEIFRQAFDWLLNEGEKS